MRPKPKTGSWVSGSSCLYKIIVGDGIFAKHLKRIPWTLQILEDAFNLRGNDLNSFFEIKDALQHMLKFANMYRFTFSQSVANFITQYGSNDLKEQLKDVEDDVMKLNAAASLFLLAEVYDKMLHNGDLLDSLEVEADELRFHPFYIDKFDNRYYYFGWDVIFRTSMDKINDSDETQESEPFPVAYSHIEFMNIFEATSKRGIKLSDEAKAILLRISNYKRAKPSVRLKSARILNKMEQQHVAARTAANTMNLEKVQYSEDDEDLNGNKNVVFEQQRQKRAERAERRSRVKHNEMDEFMEEFNCETVEKSPVPMPTRRSIRKRVTKVKIYPDEKISEEKIEKTISDLVSKIMNKQSPSDGEPLKKKSKSMSTQGSCSMVNSQPQMESKVIIMKPRGGPAMTGPGGSLTGPILRQFGYFHSNTARSYSGTPVYNFPTSAMNKMQPSYTDSYMNTASVSQQNDSTYLSTQIAASTSISTFRTNALVSSTSQTNAFPVIPSSCQTNAIMSRSGTSFGESVNTPPTWEATIKNNRIMQNRIPVVRPYRFVKNVTTNSASFRNPTSQTIIRRVFTAAPRYRNFIPVSRPLSSLNEPAKIVCTPSGQRYKIIRYQQPPPMILEQLIQPYTNDGSQTIYVEQPQYETTSYSYVHEEVQTSQTEQNVQFTDANISVQEDSAYENVQPKSVRRSNIVIKPAPRRIDNNNGGNTLNNVNGTDESNNSETNAPAIVPAEDVLEVGLKKFGTSDLYQPVEDLPPDNVLEIGNEEWFENDFQCFDDLDDDSGNQ